MRTNDTHNNQGGFPRSALGLLLLGLLAIGVPVQADDPQPCPTAPGILFIEGVGVNDVVPSTDGPGQGARCWAWSWGALTVTDETVTVTEALGNLSLPYDVDLGGASRGRRLLFADGEYPIDAPLVLTGESFQIFVSRGVLEIGAGRLVFADRKAEQGQPATQYLLFLGVSLVTIFLMMKARARLKKS